MSFDSVAEFEIKIAEFFGLIDAYERIELLEKDSHPDRKEEFDEVINALEDTVKRHENNLMHLQKNVQALKMEADILLKKSE